MLGSLFEPLALAGATAPNRVMTSAMTLQYGEDGLISDRHLAFYRERAAGGVGLLFSEQLTATPLSPSPFASEIRAYDERQVERFQALAAELAPFPTLFFAQLFGGGVVGDSTTGLDDWRPLRGASTVAAPGGEQALPLEVGELRQIATDFSRSAAQVKAGGLDGVEVHGSHGWLVGQFLSPFYNRREDGYGGSVENRCRLALEIGAAIRAEVAEEFPLGLSLSYDELIGAAGITEEDTLAQLEVLVAAEIYDFFDLSIGSSHAEHHTIAPMSVPEGYPLAFAGRAKAVVGERAAIFVAGRITDVGMAAAAIRDGAADMVAMSRAHLADPHLVGKARDGRAAEVRRCVGANVCVGRALLGEPVACVLTPATGREVGGWQHGDYERIDPAAVRRVLVVGAGPAGLRAGAVAAARGHNVIVFERAEAAGGHLADLSWLPTRGGWATAVEDMVAGLERSGGELRTGVDVDPELIACEAPELVLLATGAEWEDTGVSGLRPGAGPLSVAGGCRAIGLGEALRESAADAGALGSKVLVFDETGAYAPLGLAEALASAGVEVEVVTPLERLGAEAAMQLELGHLLPRLRKLGVELTFGREVAAVEAAGVRLADAWSGQESGQKEWRVGVDALVLAVERRPRRELAAAMKTFAGPVRLLGDALVPRSTTAAIHEAEQVGLAL